MSFSPDVSLQPATVGAGSVKPLALLRSRSSHHPARKLYHLSMGLLCFGLYGFVLDRAQALTCLIVGGALVVGLDVVRLFSTQVNQWVLKVFGSMMRDNEVHRLSANSFFVFGLLTAVVLFPKPIVLLSILYLALGDPIAAWVGSRHGKTKILWGRKSLEGCLANAWVSWVVTFLFGVLYLELGPERAFILAFIGAPLSVLAELLPLPADDNFTIPIASGLGLAAIAGRLALIP